GDSGYILRLGKFFLFSGWQCVGPMPRVSPLNSQAAFRSQASGAVFSIGGVLEGFHWPAHMCSGLARTGGPGGGFFALEVGGSAFAFFNLVVLLAHKTLLSGTSPVV